MGPVLIRVGIIGCGWIGGVHSRAIRALVRGEIVDAAVVATCDVHVERARAFAQAHSADLVTDDPAIVIDAADVVWICTPTSMHRPLVERAAAAGVGVYCEKPLAPTMVDVLAIVEAVEQAGIPNQVGLVLRAEAPIVTLQRMVAAGSGQLGRPMAALFRDDQFFPVQGHYVSAGGGTWRADAAQAGGGTLLEHSIHDIDVLAWLLGPVGEVTCRTANYAGHEGIEDVAAVTLTHEGGATSSLMSVWHNVMSRPSTRRLEVFCERALLWLDEEGAGPVHVEGADGVYDVEADTAGGWVATLPVRDEWRAGLAPYVVADRAFLDAVASGTAGWPGFDAALAAHRVADAAYRSAALGGTPTQVALL